MPETKTRRARGEGSVHFSKAKGCWVWRAVTGFKPAGGVSYTEGRARTQKAALERKRKAEGSNRQPGGNKQTVGERLEHWLVDVAKVRVRGNTWRRYEAVVRLHLKPHIGGVPVTGLDVASVNRLWAKLSKAGMSAGNVRKCSAVLSTAMEHAVSEGVIAISPTRSASRPPVSREPIEIFSDAEVKAILAAADRHWLKALWCVSVASGARMGELLALELRDVDLVAGTLHIRRTIDFHEGEWIVLPPKTPTGVRVIGLPQFALDALRDHMADRGEGPMFTTRTGRYRTKSHTLTQDWEKLLVAAKVPYRKFHALRHTHASRLLAAGVDPVEVARRLGDKIETVMRYYAHWINTSGRDTAEKLQAMYA